MNRLVPEPLKEVKYHREILISSSGNAGGYIELGDSECGSGCQAFLVIFILIFSSPFAGLFYWGVKRTRKLREDQDKMRKEKEEKLREKKNIEKATTKFEKLEKDIAEKYKKICQETIYENRYALQTERKKFLTKDSYGRTIDIGWESWENLKGDKPTAINYFWENILKVELKNSFENIDYPKIIVNDHGLRKEFSYNLDWAKYCFAKINFGKGIFTYYEATDSWIIDEINKVCDEMQDITSQFGDTSSMDGVQYEQYCKNILEDAGWEVEDTPITGDQGVDLIASIEDLRVCIQCKCFTKAVGNKAVQEVSTGMIHWNGTHAVVVATNGFTKSAKTLAASAKVILTSDTELENLENLVL